MTDAARAAATDIIPDVKQFSIGSRWVYDGDSRFDATNYASDAILALNAIEACKHPKEALGTLCGTIWHPVQNQARSNFKRIYTDSEHGTPFLSSREMFFLPLRPDRFLSNKMPKLRDLMVPKGWLLLSRSGTVGNVLYVNDRIASCAITDHAIRIEPTSVPAGYLYIFLASPYGQAIIAKGIYGATVDELEPKHIATVPVPLPSRAIRESIHEKVVRAYELRESVNALLDEADNLLHSVLELSPFSEKDIEYFGGAGGPPAFSISSADIVDRLDATSYVPLVRSVLRKLERARFKLVPLERICSTVFIPARFKRKYVALDKGVPYLLPSQLLPMRPYEMKAISQRQAAETPEYLLTQGHLLLTTDGTVGRVHPVTRRMLGWFGSNNMARLWDDKTDMGFLYAFLATPFGVHQLCKDIYGGVVDHINEPHIKAVLCPDVPVDAQRTIGDLVRQAFDKKDAANDLEDQAIEEMESVIVGKKERRRAATPTPTIRFFGRR